MPWARRGREAERAQLSLAELRDPARASPVVLFATGRPLAAGCVLTAAFLAASIGVRASERLRGISFSLMIFAAVTFAMCFPAPLVAWGDFKLSLLIVPLLQIIMFGMGTVMSAKDFVAVVKSPKAVGSGAGPAVHHHAVRGARDSPWLSVFRRRSPRA